MSSGIGIAAAIPRTTPSADRGGERVRILLCDSHRLLVEALAEALDDI